MGHQRILDSILKAWRLLEDFQRERGLLRLAFSNTGCNMENGLENIQSGREEPVSGHCVNPVGSSLSKEVVAETES